MNPVAFHQTGHSVLCILAVLLSTVSGGVPLGGTQGLRTHCPMRHLSIGVGRQWQSGVGQPPGPVFEGRRAWMAPSWSSIPAARCCHALVSRSVSARAVVGPRPGVGALFGGPECPDPSAGRRAVRPEPASVRLAAGVAEPLLSPQPVPARQRYKRVARCWERPWLTPAWLTPRLVRAALALGEPAAWGPSAGQVLVALDSVRCGSWEVFTLGVVWHGRVVPVSWAVLPYPWPKGQVTPTVCRLLRQVG